MDSEKLLRVISIALALCGLVIMGAAFITGFKVLWTIGPGLLGAGVTLFVLFGKPQGGNQEP